MLNSERISDPAGMIRAFVIPPSSSFPAPSDGPSLSTVRRRLALGGIVIALATHAAPENLLAASREDEAALTREAARELRSSVPYGEDAVREGRKHYLRLCQNCHGKDGRALESFDFEATDLTQPDRYRHGATDGDLFFSTREGAGNDMPPFKDKLTDQQVWEVVWFLRSIGPESARPGASVTPAAVESEAP
jgi:mono/diheme cytochrome c family protein